MAGSGHETGDLLMMVLPTPGNPIPGESGSVTDIPQSALDSQLMKGFKRKFMFEISGFKFGVRSQKSAKQAKQDYAKLIAEFRKHHPDAKLGNRYTPEDPENTDEAVSCPVEPVTFDRPIDSSSATIMNFCVTCTTLAGAVMVKRKPAGGPAAGLPYLRMEFIDVLFTNISWSNDEPIKESCQLIARAVNVLYRPQTPDGALGPVMQGYWSRVPNSAESIF